VHNDALTNWLLMKFDYSAKHHRWLFYTNKFINNAILSSSSSRHY